jgi:hypothetical protein
MLQEAEVNHKAKGWSLDFGVPASMVRYLQISKLVNIDDENSEVESQFYLGFHTQRTKPFYSQLFDFLIEAKQRKESQLSISTSNLDPEVNKQYCSEFFVSTAPTLLDESLILPNVPEGYLIALRGNLPSRFLHCPWTMVYSTNRDGVSLQTFYHLAKNYECTVLLIEDSIGCVFGAFTSAHWIPQESYFGSGESFLFQLLPACEVYTWQPKSNHYYMLAKPDHLEIGGG